MTLCVSAFAQKSFSGHANRSTAVNPSTIATASVMGRTTAVGDTVIPANFDIAADTNNIYWAGSTADSGYISGMDAYGDMGYAERYDFNGADSSMKVLGVVGLFGGTVSPTSTKTVKFYAWSQGPQTAVTSTVFFSGFPNNALDSVTVGATHLGIGAGGIDTFKTFMFATPTAYLSASFFVGCMLSYDASNFAGDTFAVQTNLIGERTSAGFSVSGGDTIINDQSVSMYSDGSWHDNWADNFQAAYDFYLFPVVVIGGPTSVQGVTKNDLTFFGNYPNPAATTTTVKFSLANATNVTLVVTDMNGRTLNTICQNGLSAGTHTIELPVDQLASGDYLYIIRTSAGGGMASKFTVAK